MSFLAFLRVRKTLKTVEKSTMIVNALLKKYKIIIKFRENMRKV